MDDAIHMGHAKNPKLFYEVQLWHSVTYPCHTKQLIAPIENN